MDGIGSVACANGIGSPLQRLGLDAVDGIRAGRRTFFREEAELLRERPGGRWVGKPRDPEADEADRLVARGDGQQGLGGMVKVFAQAGRHGKRGLADRKSVV